MDRVKSYRNECGCSMGGGFLIGSLLLLLFYCLFFHGMRSGYRVTAIIQGIAFVFGASILGKVIGMGIARIKLRLLYRELRIRYHDH